MASVIVICIPKEEIPFVAKVSITVRASAITSRSARIKSDELGVGFETGLDAFFIQNYYCF